MTPALFNPDNEQKVIPTLAMLTAGVIEPRVAAVIAGVHEEALYKAMAMPEVQAAVDVEITRLRLSGELATVFMKQYPGVTVEVQGGGSGIGVSATKSGACDIGALSRELTSTETGFTEYTFAKDGVAVIVNKSVNISGLTVEQIQKIFTGETKNWKEVGGIDKPIVVVAREAGSGTRGAFNELTKVLDSAKVDQTTVNAIVQPSTGAVLQTVENTPNSIGYISLGSLQNTVKALTINGVECTEANVINKTYKISRPFLYITKDKETLATETFLNWVMSVEAQKIVSRDFISVLSK